MHQELVRLHTDALIAAGYNGSRLAAVVPPPTLLTLSIWDRMVAGIGGGIHDWNRNAPRSGGTGPSCSSFSECARVMPQRVIQPLGAAVPGLFEVNEAFGPRSGWCEGSLVMAENMLVDHFGLSRPVWIDEEEYNNWVLFNGSHNATAHQPSTRWTSAFPSFRAE